MKPDLCWVERVINLLTTVADGYWTANSWRFFVQTRSTLNRTDYQEETFYILLFEAEILMLLLGEEKTVGLLHGQ